MQSNQHEHSLRHEAYIPLMTILGGIHYRSQSITIYRNICTLDI